MMIKEGDTLQDNDPRFPWRTVKVTAVGDQYAHGVSCTGRRVQIRLDRIHTDGKPRRSGFSLKK